MHVTDSERLVNFNMKNQSPRGLQHAGGGQQGGCSEPAVRFRGVFLVTFGGTSSIFGDPKDQIM